MRVSRAEVVGFVKGLLSEKFGRKSFSEDTDLRGDLLFTDKALEAFGGRINRSKWHQVVVLRGEIIDCKTVGDIIDLIAKKV